MNGNRHVVLETTVYGLGASRAGRVARWWGSQAGLGSLQCCGVSKNELKMCVQENCVIAGGANSCCKARYRIVNLVRSNQIFIVITLF